MVQSALFFIFGFLIALFLALLVAPAIWRRAVYLTRKRIESAVPLTANELLADKDRLRAEHAVELRKVSLNLSREREKAVEFNNKLLAAREDIANRTADQEQKAARIAELEEIQAKREDQIRGLQADKEDLNLQLSTTSAELAARGGEVESLSHLLSETEARLAEANEAIAARDKDIERLTASVADLKQKRNDDQTKVRESRAENRATAELLKSERARVSDIEKRLNRAIAANSDLEDKLTRREKELARLKEKRAGEDAEIEELEARLAAVEQEKADLDREAAEMTVRLNRIAKAAGDEDAEKAIEAVKAENGRLAAELKALKIDRDNLASKAKAAIAAAKATKPAEGDGDRKLRETMQQLAAEVVHLTALVEGKDSRIHQLLAKANGDGGAASLADRIKSLRKAAGDGAKAD